MNRWIPTLLLSLALAPAIAMAQAAPDWRALLKDSYAKVVEGQYRYRTFQRCTQQGSGEVIHIRSSAQAPTSAVSRDFFLWFVGAYENRFIEDLERGAGDAPLTCQSAPEPDEVPDIALLLIMNDLGFRADVAYSGGRTDSTTQAWVDTL